MTTERVNEIRSRTCSELANTYLLLNDHIKAEKAFRQAIKEAISSGVKTSDSMIIEMSMKLALIYSNSGQIKKASNGFEYCIQIQKKKLIELKDILSSEDITNERALLAMCLNYYAKHLFKTGNMVRAVEYFEDALSHCTIIYDESNKNCLNLSLDLALTESKRDPVKSLNRLNEIICKVSDSVNNNEDVLINALLEAAVIEATMLNFIKAREYLEKAEFKISVMKNSKDFLEIYNDSASLIEKWKNESETPV